MRNGLFFMLAFFACGPESAWEPLRVDRAVCGYRGARAVLSRLMSRLRKEVLASRVGNGEDAAAAVVAGWQIPVHLGQKLRLGGGALGADPTYLLYLAYRSHGGI